MPTAYCAHCGQPVDAGAHVDAEAQVDAEAHVDAGGHEGCQQAGRLDPPRYCTECGRRMIVKVTPDRWTAECSRHGPAVTR
jgi:hypothetical protein